MKRILSLLLTISLVFTLAACSSRTAISSQSQTSQTTNADSVQTTSHGAVAATTKSTVSVANTEEILAETHDSPDDYVWDASTETSVILNSNSITADQNSVAVDGSLATITAPGNYRISGTLSDGQIVVDTSEEGVVRLILDGASIHNSNSSAIYVKNADKVVLVLAENSSNQVSDGSTYVFAEADTDEPNAAIFSKTDLTIAGSGALTVTANYNDGISSKDGLIIAGGSININAADDGIRGKDYLVVKDGSLDVTAVGDALKSDNEDETTPGYITLLAGAFNLVSGDDAMDSAGDVTIYDGSFTVVTGSGSNSALSADASAKGIKAAGNITINNGAFDLNSADDTLNANGEIVINGGSYTLASGDDAMHADISLTINTGEILINQSYEGLESAQIELNGGTIHLTSSDDGINISSGNDGSGMGGMDGGGMGPGGGNRPFGGGNPPADGGAMPQGGGPAVRTTTYSGDTSTTTSNMLTIRDGYIVINAGGDGLDANGGIEMSGGTVIVNGPTENNNGAIDYTSGFVMTGGTLIAVGSSGMAQAPDSSSTQNAILVNFSSRQDAGTLIHIQDSTSRDILTYQTVKQFQSIAFSSPELVSGGTYTISLGGSSSGSAADNLYQGGSYSGGTVYTDFTISNVVTAIGTAARNR